MIAGLIEACERGFVPDFFIRRGIRRLCGRSAARYNASSVADRRRDHQEFVNELKRSPVAIEAGKANEQHYEMPPEFFVQVLGARRKYSCCYFSKPGDSLDVAETAMLDLYIERGQFADGQQILELGCGWGSLTLRLAELFPNARIVGVSNSSPQRRFIEAECQRLGFRNVEIVTADMNHFEPTPPLDGFDRVVSIEMFEHMRNYQELLRRIARWLKPTGRLFVHIFVHREWAYPFETERPEDWMGRHFFTGGVMPSDELLLRFQEDMVLEDHWRVGGEHYQRTSDCWLANLDAHRDRILPILTGVAGEQEAPRLLQRWRMFFLACAEMFGFDHGREWFVAHYRFARRHDGELRST